MLIGLPPALVSQELNSFLTITGTFSVLTETPLYVVGSRAPMGSPSRGGGVSRLSLPTPFSPIFVCPSAYRNLSPVLLFTHQLLPTYLQFSSSDCPFCLHRPFTYISLLYKPSFCHFSFSPHTFSPSKSEDACLLGGVKIVHLRTTINMVGSRELHSSSSSSAFLSYISGVHHFWMRFLHM